MTKVRRNQFILILIIFTVFWLASCSSDDPAETINDDPIPEVEAGISELEKELFDMINSGNIESPDDMDFTKAKEHFEKAVKIDPTNLDAQFGFSLTTLLALTSDREVNDAFDEWEAYLEVHTPFQDSDKALSPLGVPLTFASGNRSMELPLEIMAQSLTIGMQPKMEVVEPSIADVQDVFRNTVIPALETAAAHLGIVIDNPDYIFSVTPMMLGDAEEDALELDMTEILAARAGVLLLSTACRLAVAYDLSFPSFDATGIVDGLDYETGNMLRLREGGGTQMNRVETDFLAAVDAVDDGIWFLLNETDPQDDDIIKIGPDDISHNDLVDFRVNDLPKFRDIFGEEGLVLTEDWDNSYMTPDQDLTVNAHNFFTNPIADWKKVFPPYTVTTREVEEGYHPHDSWYYHALVQSETAGYGEGGCTFWVGESIAVRDSTWGHPDISYMAAIICEQYVDYLYWYQYSYDGTVTVFGDHDLVVGTNYVDFEIDSELVSDAPRTVIPHFTWEAETFEDWKAGWENYNLNGLLPDMQSTDQLFTTFGFTADDWNQEFDIDWTELD